jgi:hypothetical protein
MDKPVHWILHVQKKTLAEFQRDTIQAEDMAMTVNLHRDFSFGIPFLSS